MNDCSWRRLFRLLFVSRFVHTVCARKRVIRYFAALYFVAAIASILFHEIRPPIFTYMTGADHFTLKNGSALKFKLVIIFHDDPKIITIERIPLRQAHLQRNVTIKSLPTRTGKISQRSVISAEHIFCPHINTSHLQRTHKPRTHTHTYIARETLACIDLGCSSTSRQKGVYGVSLVMD